MRNKSVEDLDEITTSRPPVAVAVPVSPNDASSTPLAISEITATITARPDTPDEEAFAAVVTSQEQGIADIRHHCVQHLWHNPSSSYVTWIATLHPENAQITIDPRFLTPDNPWLTVYEEAKEDLQKGKGATTTVSPSAPGMEHAPIEGEEDKDTDASPTYAGCLDLFISSCLILVCVIISLALEVAAGYAYFSYWLCMKIVVQCSPAGAFSWLPLSIAWIVGQVFCLVDIVLLFVSVFVVEVVAVVNYILCAIFACSHEVGKNVHQMTRKLPHHVRWAFRHNFECSNPPRLYFRNYVAAGTST
eukprot:CAMPEP_0172301054 /NCGR_PEP_ID=MMETSP1058-20130122/3023_1 /TAXON_ID=83371 /ORGANISM="Detonula confervacea, Strain CCMP 353" /LENGTH=303 /DNA_ID=CAMNT_0013011047 /DNA_START=9 /DNA_END=920 /DNA_ORIENTATION=-